MGDVVRSPGDGRAALGLRLAGASFGEVAQVLGFADAEAARRSVERELGRQVVPGDGLEGLRAEEAARLERLLRSVWPKAMDGDSGEHLPAVKVALQLIDRHARLLGLDVPQEVVVHNPSQAEIDAWVAEVVKPAVLGVVEGEVVVDD